MSNEDIEKSSSEQALSIVDAVSVAGYQLHMFDTEPMIRDLHLADRLGYANPYKIRELIKRMIEKGQLKSNQVVTMEGKSTGGKTSLTYHLNEHACIKVITKSETAMADEITDEVLDVFIAVRSGKLQQPSTTGKYAEIFLEMAALNPPTPGYFSVLNASSDMLYACVGAGMPFDEHSIALISIGQHWKKHYDSEVFSSLYGEPKKFRQMYPESFPQSAVNEYKEVWHYPVDCMGQFVTWMMNVYMPKHYPKYLKGKVKKGAITHETEERLLEAMNSRYLLPRQSA